MERRINAKDILCNRDIVPGCGAGEPGVLCFPMCCRVSARDHLSVDIGLALMQFTDLFPRGWIDTLVIIKCFVPAPNNSLSDHDPWIGVTEDSRILFIARRIRGNFTQVQIILTERRLLQYDSMGCGKMFFNCIKGLSCIPILNSQTRHDAYTLWFDENPSFYIFF